MFAKFLSTRTPAAASSRAPELQSGPSTQSASRTSPSLVKKLFSIKKAFRRSPSATKNADSEGTSHRRQGVPALSQPSEVSEGLNASTYDRAGFHPHSSLHPHVEPTRSAAALSPPPRFQAEWQSSTTSVHHRSTFSATASPLLAPPQSVATTPATSFAQTFSSSNCSTQSTALRLTTSSNASLLAPPAVATIPATSAQALSSSPRSATSRSTFSPRISSPLAPPRSVVTTPATTFSSTRRPAQRPAVFTALQSISPFDGSPLLAPPPSVATTPPTEHSPTFSSFNCSKPTDNSTHQLIAELEETVSYLHSQHDAARRCVHTMIQWQVFPYAKSLSDEAKTAKEELDEVMKQIAAVDIDCSELEALLRDEHEKLEEVEEALKRAYLHREGVNEEHAMLQDDVHELQAGQPVNGVWQQRAREPLQQDYAPSQSVAEQERGSSLAASDSFPLEKKRVTSWDSQWESMIARQRYSLPRSVHAVEAVTMSEQEANRSASAGGRAVALDPTQRMTPGEFGKKASPAFTAQGLVVASNESGRRTNNARVRDAHQAYTSDYFGRPLRWGQFAPSSPVRARKSDAQSSKHA